MDVIYMTEKLFYDPEIHTICLRSRVKAWWLKWLFSLSAGKASGSNC
jgi:hypothetical protein